MSRLPRITGSETIKALRDAGFQVVRIRGSHHVLKHPDGRTTVVPVHAGETLGTGLMGKILKDAQMSREEFEGLL